MFLWQLQPEPLDTVSLHCILEGKGILESWVYYQCHIQLETHSLSVQNTLMLLLLVILKY